MFLTKRLNVTSVDAEEVELSEDEPESNDVDEIDPFSEDESDTD